MAVVTKKLKALYFQKFLQAVERQVLSTRGQADVNLHRLTGDAAAAAAAAASASTRAATVKKAKATAKKPTTAAAKKPPSPRCKGGRRRRRERCDDASCLFHENQNDT